MSSELTREQIEKLITAREKEVDVMMAQRNLAEAKLAASQERVKLLEAIFDRHRGREKAMAEIVFQHIKHGDEKHQEWLRAALVEAICREDTKACITFDTLTQRLATVEEALGELYDVQNGPPLETTAVTWQLAMDRARLLLFPAPVEKEAP